MTGPRSDDERSASPREDGATFEVTRVRSGRAPRFLAAGALVAVGSLVGLGLLDKQDGAPAPVGPDVAQVSTPSSAQATRPGHTREDPGQRAAPRPPPAHGPVVVDSVMQLDLRPAGSRLFVHGDIYSLDVTRVVVSVQDRAGHVAQTTSVKLQGGSTAFRIGANTRFDTLFEVPDELMGEGLVVRADAYDIDGRILVAVRKPIVAPVLDQA